MRATCHACLAGAVLRRVLDMHMDMCVDMRIDMCIDSRWGMVPRHRLTALVETDQKEYRRVYTHAPDTPSAMADAVFGRARHLSSASGSSGSAPAITT